MLVRHLNLKPRQVLPRMVADFVNIHLCMVTALTLSVFYQPLLNQADPPLVRLGEATHYYTSEFVLLSLLFPVTYLLNGFYTRSRGYGGRYKNLVILRGTALSILLIIAANFLFFRRSLAPRSAVVLFCCLALPSMVLSRLAKAALLVHIEIKTKRLRHACLSEGLVLVLGGAGYIGSCVLRKLLTTGRKVRVMDSLLYGDEAIRDIFYHPNVQWQIGDCRKIQDLIMAVKGVDSIVDLVAITEDEACEVDRQASLEVNYAVTRILIEIAKGNGIRRMVFASSCSVYGASDLLVDEFSIAQPCSLYGQTKVDSEQALLRACSRDFNPSVVRLASVFGGSYRPRFDLVVNLLTAQAYVEGRITVINGTQWRPLIHVQDAAEGIVQILNSPLEVVSGEIYNLGDSRMNFTLAQVAEKVLAEFPLTQVEYVENSDGRNYRVSFEKIRNQIGFECHLSLEDGIREIRKALEDKQISTYTDSRHYNQKYLKQSGSQCCKDRFDAHVMAALAEISPLELTETVLSAKTAGAVQLSKGWS